MPVIPVGSQIFDLAFHPTSNVVYTGLLNGKVKAFTYDDQGAHDTALSLRISKRSCRGLALSPDGSSLYAVGKNRSLQCVYMSSALVRKYKYMNIFVCAVSIIDTGTGTLSETRQGVHE